MAGRVFRCKCNNSKVEGSGREILALEPAAGGRAAGNLQWLSSCSCWRTGLEMPAVAAVCLGTMDGWEGDSLALYKGLIGPSLGRAK